MRLVSMVPSRPGCTLWPGRHLPSPGIPASLRVLQAPEVLVKRGLVRMVQNPTSSSHPSLPAFVPISFTLLSRLEITYPAQSHPLFVLVPDAAPGTSLCPPAPFPGLYWILFCTFTHAAFLSHLRKEKKVSCSHLLLLRLSYFSALFCCRTSGKSFLYWLSAVPPLPFSVKPTLVSCSPRLLARVPTLPKPCLSGSLSTSKSPHPKVTSLSSSYLTCHCIYSLPSPGDASSLAFQAAVCLGFSSHFSQ